MLRYHSPVQVQVDRVHRQRSADAIQYFFADLLVRIVRDMSRRAGRAPQNRHELVALRDRGLGKAPRRNIGAGNSLEHGSPAGQTGPTAAKFKGTQVGSRRSESIGFVLETGKDDTHDAILESALATARKTARRAAACAQRPPT